VVFWVVMLCNGTQYQRLEGLQPSSSSAPQIVVLANNSVCDRDDTETFH